MSSNHHAQILYVNEISSVDIGEFVSAEQQQDLHFEKFTVADAKGLIDRAFIRPAEGNSQLCVVRTNFITLEAQNALLKIFEEPPVSTSFLLVVPPDFTMLPTLLSRCEVIAKYQKPAPNAVFADFFNSTYAARLALIEKANKNKDTSWQREIKQGLIEYLKIPINTKKIKELEYAARLLLTRGASNKFLLEHVALSLPTSSKV